MHRRRVIASIAGLATLPAGRYATRSPRESVDIRYWLSPGAARYGVQDRIREYVEAALRSAFDVHLSFGGIAPVTQEHGYHVTRSGEWPRQVSPTHQRATGIESAPDGNLLVTDGEIRHGPTGLARGRVASIGGARYLQDLPPRDEIENPVPYGLPFFVMHVLLHEIGHVLGLEHEHGDIDAVNGGTVVTPMVSTYAWRDPRDQFAGDYCVCGTPYPQRRGGARLLSFEFSDCAHDAFAAPRGILHR